MLIFVVERKKIYIFASILACLCLALILLHVSSGRKMSIGAFLTLSDSEGRKPEQVEIFDIGKGLVTGSYDNNAGFRKETFKYLDSITGMYGNVKVFPKYGYIVKIPLDPPAKASAKLLTAAGIEYANKIYIILPSQGKPYLLLLDGQSKPLCFNFDADTTYLHRYILNSRLFIQYNPGSKTKYGFEQK